MGKDSKISWTDNSFNAWWGCQRIGDGCVNCYAERLDARYHKEGHWGNNDRKMMSEKYWKQPIAWNDEAKRLGITYKVFCSSMADVFEDNEQVIEARNRLWELIKQTPHLYWQILTKRYDKIIKFLPPDWGDGYDNVWLGVSAGSQKTYNEMMFYFKDVPAKTKFLSAEPLHGEIILKGLDNEWKAWDNIFDQVIVGGESGNETGKYLYRKCNIAWIERIVYDCKHADVACFVKQMGTYLSKQMSLHDRHGADINEFPDHLKFQEFPKSYIKPV